MGTYHHPLTRVEVRSEKECSVLSLRACVPPPRTMPSRPLSPRPLHQFQPASAPSVALGCPDLECRVHFHL